MYTKPAYSRQNEEDVLLVAPKSIPPAKRTCIRPIYKEDVEKYVCKCSTELPEGQFFCGNHQRDSEKNYFFGKTDNNGLVVYSQFSLKDFITAGKLVKLSDVERDEQ